MPLVYQGRLNRGRLSGPSPALRAGERALADATTDRRVDVRLAWDGPEPFARCVELLPDDFDGFWLDIAVEAEPRRLDRVLEWARTLRGGRLGLASLAAGRENEVTIDLPGAGPIRLDAERLDPLRAHLHVERLRVTYREGGERAPSSERRALAAGRTRAAYDRLTAFADGALVPYPAVFVDDPRSAPADPRWLDVGYDRDQIWFTGPAPVPPRLPAAQFALKPRVVDDAPFGLTLTLPAEAIEQRAAIWRRWLGLLEQVDLVLLRCTGTLAQMRAVLDAFDLHHRHPHRPHQTFGITTVHTAERVPIETLGALVGSPMINEPLVDWGVRWSNLQLALEGSASEAPRGPTASFYVVRDERDRTYDHLQICLDTEDPRAAVFRFARRQLAARFGRLLEQPSAWQYTGPAVDSPLGRRYTALAEAIAALPASIVAAPTPIEARTPRPPRWIARWIERLTRGEAEPLAAAFEAALSAQMPGFRHDRRAHLTDQYFVSFVRATAGGYHIIHLRRLHAPAGFRISVGVSRVPIQLADLDPGVGRTAPGWATPLGALAPERSLLDWRYTGAPSAARAIDDAVALLAARAAPFFERAEACLCAFAQDEEEP